MLIDYNSLVSDNQTLVFTAGAVLSDKSYDLGTGGVVPQFLTASLTGVVPIDPGRGFPVQAWAQMTVDYAATGGASTCKVELVSAADAALTSSLTVLMATAAISKASLVAGYQFRLGVIPGGVTQRYLGFRYTTATNDCTTGTISAGFIINRQSDYGTVGV